MLRTIDNYWQDKINVIIDYLNTLSGNDSYDPSGNLEVNIQDPRTAFGELRVANMTPVLQNDFIYLTNDRLYKETTAGSGAVLIAKSMLVAQTGTTTASTVEYESIRRVKYRAGQGVISRFTGVFTTGVANTTQYIGIIDVDNGFAFGYNGDTFGILHRADTSGFIVDTWIPQTSWNVDKADGTGTLPTFNPTNGNVFEITFQYLGFGMITFSVENPTTGGFVRVHQIEYANSNTIPSIGNATLPFEVYADNGSTTTDIITKTASVGIYTEGKKIPEGVKTSHSNNITTTATEAQFFTLLNKTTYGSITNHVEALLQYITASVSSSGNRNMTVKVLKNATLAGTSYTDVDANASPLQIDTAGTLTGGTGEVIFSFTIANNTSQAINLSTLDLFFSPGETLTISGTNSSGSGDSSVSLSILADE